MKGRSMIIRWLSFFLLLIFSQKTGIGLTLHNLLHSSTLQSQSPRQQGNDKEISYACSCVDDFVVPFTPAEETFLTPHQPVGFVTHSFLIIEIPFRPHVFLALRGPPAANA